MFFCGLVQGVIEILFIYLFMFLKDNLCPGLKSVLGSQRVF